MQPINHDLERSGSGDRQRHHSERSAVSLDPGRMRRSGSSVIIKRTSSTPSTDKPFQRVPSHGLGQTGSSKSMTSIRTRITIISRSEYHQDSKLSLSTVSGRSMQSTHCRIISYYYSPEVHYDTSGLHKIKGIS